jgi:hypothetical protein
MPKVVDAARVTAAQSAVWRTCAGCGQLVALPPEIDHCSGCEPRSDAGAALTVAELDEARAHLTEVCQSCRTQLDRLQAVNAYLVGYFGSTVTAAVAGDPYVRKSLRRAAAFYAVREQVTQ